MFFMKDTLKVRYIFCAFVLYYGWGGLSKKAHACSPSPSFLEGRGLVFPEDKSIDLPRNLRILVQYTVGEQFLDILKKTGKLSLEDLRLVSEHGQIIPLDIQNQKGYSSYVQLYVAKPKELLLSNTTYHLQSRVKPSACRDATGESCLFADYQTFSSFTTGAQEDTQAPGFQGIQEFLVTKMERSDSCGSFKGLFVSIKFSSSTHEAHPKWLRYHLFHASNLQVPIFRNIRPEYLSFLKTCQGSYPNSGEEASWSALLREGESYVLRVVDVAGNIDSNVQSVVYRANCSVWNSEERLSREDAQEVISEKAEAVERESDREAHEGPSDEFDGGLSEKLFQEDTFSEYSEATKDRELGRDGKVSDSLIISEGCGGCQASQDATLWGLWICVFLFVLARRRSCRVGL